MGDLNMLAVTGGKERGVAQWKTLLNASGFELERMLPVPGEKTKTVEEAWTIEASPSRSEASLA